MGIFDKLKESIFGHHNAAPATPADPFDVSNSTASTSNWSQIDR